MLLNSKYTLYQLYPTNFVMIDNTFLIYFPLIYKDIMQIVFLTLNCSINESVFEDLQFIRHAKATDIAKTHTIIHQKIPSKEPWSGWHRGRGGSGRDAHCLSLGSAIISASTRSKDATRWTCSGCCCYCRKEKETLSV